MPMNEIFRAVDRMARRQHGVLHRDQLFALGVTRHMIATRLANNSWIRLAPSVYAIASFPPTWLRQCKAAALATPGSSICGLPAGHLLDWEGSRALRPEVAASPSANHGNRLAKVHRVDNLATTSVKGIRVTTHAQTLCDVLTSMNLDRWEQTCDRLLLTNQMTVRDLEERVEAYAGSHRPSIALLRALLQVRSADGWEAPESELETLLRAAVALVPGCPEVVWQAPAPWGDDERVDGLIPAWRLILEGDGRAWHARVHDFDRDRWRDARAAAYGLRVQRFTHVHLNHRLPEVVELIGQAGATTHIAA